MIEEYAHVFLPKSYVCRQSEISKMAECDTSLTAMDWLHELNVHRHLTNGKLATSHGDQLSKNGLGQVAIRKPPNSPLDTGATYEDADQSKDGKPPYSYANLITFAINSSVKKKMTLSEIYQWICDNFPYYKEAGNGWKVNFAAMHMLMLYHFMVTLIFAELV